MSSYTLEVFDAIYPFRTDGYHFNQLNERVCTVQDNTGATALVSEPQLELRLIVRVRIECHR